MGALALLLSCAPSSATDKARSGGDPIQIEGELPCDVDRILSTVCQYCHTRPPRNGAPFSLVTYGDTQVIVDGRPVVSYVAAAVASGRMPLAPMSLTEQERTLLVEWASRGGPRREGSCTTKDAGAEEDAADAHVDAGAAADADVDAADAAEE